MIKSLCGLIITTSNMDKMLQFYKEGLGLALEKESHDDLAVHYGVDLSNHIHFALHPPENFKADSPGQATAKLAFEVQSLDKCVEQLKRNGFEIASLPVNMGFGTTLLITDPDGNMIELVELSYDFDNP